MRLWLNRSADVPLREQLITQVVLAILTREVLPGQRLPSTRELARRFGIHPNTASAAYRQLEQEGWLELRHGSGVFVSRARRGVSLSSEIAPESRVDRLIGELAARARSMGASDALLRARFLRWLSFEPPARWLVIEPDPELCRIVTLEMEENLALPVTGCEPAHCASPEMLERSIPVVLPSKAEAVRKLLPAGTELTVLQVQAITPALQAKLQRYLPEHSSDLVGIASRWSQFQQLASIMIVAAGLAQENLFVRDATRPGWKRGLEATTGVICDVVVAQELPQRCFPIVFRLLSEASLAQLRAMETALSEKRPASASQPAL
ncbi:MAG: GntR family transcriptional regulator [Terracidiphilus sp.]|jgi:GntR family transcriptional regulator